jgi:hypothetical protein
MVKHHLFIVERVPKKEYGSTEAARFKNSSDLK